MLHALYEGWLWLHAFGSVSGVGACEVTITHQRAEKAITYMIENAEEYADACAEVAKVEDSMKSTKAALMNASAQSSAAMKECDAMANAAYIELIGKRGEAIRRQTYMKTRLKAEELVCDVFRTIEASNRRVDRAAQ